MHVHDLTTAAERRAHVADLENATSASGNDHQLRHHLENDHQVDVYEDDSSEYLVALHDGHHRQPAPEPVAPAEEVPAEVRAARAEVELYRLKQAELAYDVDMPSTLRERMAYARSLASSGLIPKAFRSGRGGDDGLKETTANVLLAVELGNTLGLSPLQALCQVNVVEGKPGLGAEGQLAQVIKAGHDIYVDDDASDATKAVVVCQRDGQDRVHRITYTLEDAIRGGLVRIVEGQPYARSSNGKALPWETSTPDMLVWRAVTRACKRVFPDVVGGLAAVDDEPGTQYAPGASSPAATPTAPARATRAPAATDSVEDDLALFSDTAGNGPWWVHAGATVRRRSKLQLAADRLADALAAGDDRVPPREDIVDAELVEDQPVAEPAQADPTPAPEPATVVDVGAEAAELRTHLAAVPDEPVHADPVEGEAQDITPADADPWTEPADDQPVVEDPPAEPTAPADRAELWAQVEALAKARDKTVPQLMARHVLATRVNPEDMTADQLQAFLAAQQGL